jgi:hypothetical protein
VTRRLLYCNFALLMIVLTSLSKSRSALRLDKARVAFFGVLAVAEALVLDSVAVLWMSEEVDADADGKELRLPVFLCFYSELFNQNVSTVGNNTLSGSIYLRARCQKVARIWFCAAEAGQRHLCCPHYSAMAFLCASTLIRMINVEPVITYW